MDPRITFFPKRKTRVELSGWAPKMNSQDEKRLRLDFTLPLVDETLDGVIPAWIIDPLNSFSKDGSVESKSKLEISLDGVTLEFWDTPKSPARTILLTAATLADFYLTRVTRNNQTFLALTFNTNVKRDAALLKWCDRYETCNVWCEFTPTDPEMPSKPVPGAQMTIADASTVGAKQEVDQTGDEAEANATKFLNKKTACAFGGYCKQEEFHSGEHDPNPSDAKVDAELASKHRRPRGFSKSTNPSAN